MQSVNIYYLIIIHLFDQKKIFGEPRCGGGGGFHARVVEQRRRWRRRPVQKRWQRRPARAASMTVEETGEVQSDGDLESFMMKVKGHGACYYS
jgi:hypothetical protein